MPEAGLAGNKDGQLLSLAEALGFDLFITMDRGIQYQQNLAGRVISILVVRANSNRLSDLLLHVEQCLLIMSFIQPGEVRQVG